MLSRKLTLGAGLLMLLLGSACAHHMPAAATPGGSALPPQVTAAQVPFFAQEENQCGPASLAMVLQWTGLAVTPDELVSEVFTPDLGGSLQTAMVTGARRHGRLAYAIQGEQALLAELAVGHPVIVLQNLGLSWFPLWHYAVALGYDRPDDAIVMHSGDIALRRVSWNRFYHTWNRSGCWGLLVLAPGSLPVDADETAYLKAALGLEQAQQWEAAQKAYHAARRRWPDSLGAMMGEGNSQAARGDWQAAEQCFRAATLRYPQNGDGFNNLAHVLARQSRLDEARRAVEMALAVGGPNTPIYRQTLNEIKSQQIAPGAHP